MSDPSGGQPQQPEPTPQPWAAPPSPPQAPAQWQPPAYGQQPPPSYGQQPPTSYGQPHPGFAQPAYAAQAVAPYGGPAAIGKVRSTGICILLSIVTLGIYQYVWYYKVHDEMKRHSGNGMGGGLALLLAILVGFVMPFITSSEVGGLYTRRGQHPPVTGVTGLWAIPGFLILVGPIVWFVKTNGALNAYWRSLGAVG